MNIVVGGIVREDPMGGVVRECVATVVQHGFDGGDSKEPHRLSHGHAREQVAETSTEGVQSKTLDRMIVQSAVGIGNVEAVMAGVEGDCRI